MGVEACCHLQLFVHHKRQVQTRVYEIKYKKVLLETF